MIKTLKYLLYVSRTKWSFHLTLNVKHVKESDHNPSTKFCTPYVPPLVRLQNFMICSFSLPSSIVLPCKGRDVDITATFPLPFELVLTVFNVRQKSFFIFFQNDRLRQIYLSLLYQRSLTEYPVFFFSIFLQSLYPELKANLLIQYLCTDSLYRLLCL